jgi:hypothetical protein
MTPTAKGNPMKRMLLILLVTLSLGMTVLSGCQNEEVETDDQEECDREKIY